MWYLALGSNNRELMAEFKDTFYRTKFGSQAHVNSDFHKESMYCINYDNGISDILIKNEQNVYASKCLVRQHEEDAPEHSAASPKALLEMLAENKISKEEKHLTKDDPVREHSPEIPVDSLPEASIYTVTVEFRELQIGGVSELSEEGIISLIKAKLSQKMAMAQRDDRFLFKVKIFLENISQNKMQEFCLYASNEDNVKYSEKMIIFEAFTAVIEKMNGIQRAKAQEDEPNSRHIGDGPPDTFHKAQTKTQECESDYTGDSPANNAFYKNILYSEDVLKRYCPNDIIMYLNWYISILHTHTRASSILSKLKLEDVSVLFSMCLQRNIYVFFSPVDLDSIETSIDTHELENLAECVSPNNRSNFKRILSVAQMLYCKNRTLSELVVYAWYRKSLSDSVLKGLLGIS